MENVDSPHFKFLAINEAILKLMLELDRLSMSEDVGKMEMGSKRLGEIARQAGVLTPRCEQNCRYCFTTVLLISMYFNIIIQDTIISNPLRCKECQLSYPYLYPYCMSRQCT